MAPSDEKSFGSRDYRGVTYIYSYMHAVGLSRLATAIKPQA